MIHQGIIEEVVTQHAEETAFLWLLRDGAIYAPHYSLVDLAQLDARVDAHLDGLRIAGDVGWELCKEAMSQEEAGEIFAAAILAFVKFRVRSCITTCVRYALHHASPITIRVSVNGCGLAFLA